MINNKGFTLVELLASIAILAIISLIAVPSILSISDKNKKEVYVNDAKRFVSIAKYEANKHAEKKDILNSTGLYYYEDYDQCILDISNSVTAKTFIPTTDIDNYCLSTTDIDISPNSKKYINGYVRSNEVCLTDGVYSVKGQDVKNISISDVYEYSRKDCKWR